MTTELFNEVLGSKAFKVEVEKNRISFWTKKSTKGNGEWPCGIGWGHTINKDTMTRKIKEWAWKTHFVTIRSGYAEFGACSNFAHNDISFVNINKPYTEFQAVLEAAIFIIKGTRYEN